MISTQDGGQHWQDVSQQPLQRIQIIDDTHGYGIVADKFFRTDDGGRSWVETKLPNIASTDRMMFLTPEMGGLLAPPP